MSLLEWGKEKRAACVCNWDRDIKGGGSTIKSIAQQLQKLKDNWN